jgi:glutaminyl-peptide cyclotransferase
VRRLAIAVIALAACGGDPTSSPDTTMTGSVVTTSSTLPTRTSTRRMTVRVVETVAHDPEAFTQGLVFAPDGALFESTGLEGRSSIRELDPATGAVTRIHELAPSSFGEGLALVGDRLVQLTYREERAFVYDRDTFELTDTFMYEGEGWGLCFDGTSLVMSNGTDELTFRDPSTFDVVRRVAVTMDGQPLTWLNELECIDGQVYANLWQSDLVAVIDSTTGVVRVLVDASSLARPADADVMNGIAVDPSGGLWLTGKLWDAMYRVELAPG